nr:putative ribonuclease H-like domain-containing protein [Tanacetum cinerariifolium]
MNYQPVTAGNQSNPSAGIQEQFDVEKAGEENVQQYVLFPLRSSGFKKPQNTNDDATFGGNKPEFEGEKLKSKVYVSPSSSSKTKKHDDKTKREAKGKSLVSSLTGYRNLSAKFEDFSDNSINEVNTIDSLVLAVGVHKDHPMTQIIGDLSSASQTRSMTRVVKDQGGLTQINNEDFHTCMFACFLSQDEPKRVHQALKDPSWIEAMQEELIQFKMQKVWVLDDLPNGKRAIGTKWVFRNKKDERGIIVRNKARLVAQGHTQEEGIDYDKVFASVARIEAIRLFLAYASFMGFMVYQMDAKSAFLYETIEEEVYVCQSPGFEDPDYPEKVYKVVKALYGLH